MSVRKGLVMVFLASVCFSVGGLLVKMIPWQGLSIVGGVVVFVTVMAYNLLSARLEKPETSTQGS